MISRLIKSSPYGLVKDSRAVITLGVLCDATAGIQTGPFGSQLHSSDYVQQGTPIITVENLNENYITGDSIPFVSKEDVNRLSKYMLKQGDIVFSRVGSVDRRALVTEREDGWLFSGRILRIRTNPDLIDPIYLSYFFGLSKFKDYIRRIAVGATMPSLNTQIMMSIPVVVPPLKEQHAIGQILRQIDEKIRINQQISKTLEEIAQTIFKSWFVDFDPVHAKARGEQPFGMDDETAALFPDSFQDSELGPIPSGWNVCEVKDELNFVGGSTPSTSIPEYWDGEHCWTTPKDLSLQQDLITIDSARKISSAGLAKITSGLLPVGSVLMSSRAPIGYLSITNIRTAINQGFIGFPPSEIHHPIYILNWLSSNMGEIKNRAGGSSFAEISKTAFRTMPFLVPSLEISLKFGELVEPFLQEITNLTYEIRTLTQLRDALLPRLISGELEIPDELLVS